MTSPISIRLHAGSPVSGPADGDEILQGSSADDTLRGHQGADTLNALAAA